MKAGRVETALRLAVGTRVRRFEIEDNESEARYRTLVENAPEAIVTLDT